MASLEGGEEATAAATTTPPGADPEQGAGRATERHQLCTTTSSAEALELERHKLQFGLREQIAYNAMREQSLARLSRFLTGLQVFLGTSAIASISDLIPLSAVYSVIFSAFAGVVLLVVDPSGGARDHRALRVRYHHVLADYEEGERESNDLRALKAKMQRIFADAPPGFRVVQAVAFNTAVNSTYPEEEAVKYRYKIGFLRRAFGNWFPMRGFKFKLETTQ